MSLEIKDIAEIIHHAEGVAKRSVPGQALFVAVVLSDVRAREDGEDRTLCRASASCFDPVSSTNDDTIAQDAGLIAGMFAAAAHATKDAIERIEKILGDDDLANIPETIRMAMGKARLCEHIASYSGTSALDLPRVMKVLMEIGEAMEQSVSDGVIQSRSAPGRAEG